MADGNQPSRKSSVASRKSVNSAKLSADAVSDLPKVSVAVDSHSPKTSVAVDSHKAEPSVATDLKSSEPSVTTDLKSSEPSVTTDLKSSEPSVATDLKSSEPSVTTDLKSSEPSATTDLKSLDAGVAAVQLDAKTSISSAKDEVPDPLSKSQDTSVTKQQLGDQLQLQPSKTSISSRVDQEDLDVKLKYPKSVFFIITNEFCERFSFYGLRTLLAIYCVSILGYSDDTATVIYHTFVMLAYFFPILGAIIADSWLGKYRTIIYMSCVFAIGNITLTVASADQAIEGMPSAAISMVGLFLIALGTGGIKPCVSAFGGDQFIVPKQQPQLEKFFSIFYFTINAGSFCSTFITPILRSVPCLGVDSCYPLAFGVPAVLMITSIIVFLAGQSFYIIKKPTGNIIVEIFRVITHALKTKFKSRKSSDKKEHWLDYAESRFGKKSIHDIKLLLRVLFLYIPLPIFWALYDQQGSRWTFQATRMNGQIGDFTLQAEQMQVVNPLLILAFVPLFEVAVYPLLGKCNLLTKPLQRLTMGGVLAGLAFLVSAFVELTLEPTYAVVPSAGNGQLRFYNGFNCNVTIETELAAYDDENRHNIAALGIWEVKDWAVDGSKPYPVRVTLDDPACVLVPVEYTGNVILYEEKAASHFITYETGTTGITISDKLALDDVDKTANAKPKIRVIYNFIDDTSVKTLNFESKNGYPNELKLNETLVGTDYEEFEISVYTVKYGNDIIAENVKLEVGGVYSMVIQEEVPNPEKVYNAQYFTITPPNSIHMMWLMPQYIIMTAGEVMYSVTGVQFSFTQAPVSMKAVIQAGWLLTVAVGNLIVVIIAESKLFDRQIFEFLLFAALMFLDMIVFVAMSWNYKYVDLKEEEELLNQTIMLQRKSSASEKTGIDNKVYTKE